MPKNLHGPKRKSDRIKMEAITRKNKEKRIERANKGKQEPSRKCCRSLLDGKKLALLGQNEFKIPTFDDDYKSFRRTRGKRGLNPDPDKRFEENPWQKNRNSSFNVSTFKITDLMEKPIDYNWSKNKEN